jgi:hypothetical protein
VQVPLPLANRGIVGVTKTPADTRAVDGDDLKAAGEPEGRSYVKEPRAPARPPNDPHEMTFEAAERLLVGLAFGPLPGQGGAPAEGRGLGPDHLT